LYQRNPEVTTNQLAGWNLSLPTQRGLSHRFSMKSEARSLVKEKIYEVFGQRKRKSIGHGVQIIQMINISDWLMSIPGNKGKVDNVLQ
jgi:hypothetical protein